MKILFRLVFVLQSQCNALLRKTPGPTNSFSDWKSWILGHFFPSFHELVLNAYVTGFCNPANLSSTMERCTFLNTVLYLFKGEKNRVTESSKLGWMTKWFLSQSKLTMYLLNIIRWMMKKKKLIVKEQSIGYNYRILIRFPWHNQPKTLQ